MRGKCFVGRQTIGLPDTLDSNRTDHHTEDMKMTKKKRIKKYATAIDNAELSPLCGLVSDAHPEESWKNEAKAVIKVANAEIDEALAMTHADYADMEAENSNLRADNADLRTERNVLLRRNSMLERWNSNQCTTIKDYQQQVATLEAKVEPLNRQVAGLRMALRQKIRLFEHANKRYMDLRAIIRGVAEGDGYTTQFGNALIVKCDDRGQTELHRDVARLRERVAHLKAKNKRAGLLVRELKRALNAANFGTTVNGTPTDTVRFFFTKPTPEPEYEYALHYLVSPGRPVDVGSFWDRQEEAEEYRSRMTVPSNWEILRRVKNSGLSAKWETVA